MQKKQFLLLPLSLFVLLWGWGVGSAESPEIQQLNAEIQELEQQKLGFEGRALKHEYYAEYLQFNDQAVLETRRHLQLAEENRLKAAYVQAKIDELKAKRAQLKK